MAKVYTMNTWQDEVLAGDEKYTISEAGVQTHADAEIALKTGVVTAGTPVNAEKMNNIENGIDDLDNLQDSLGAEGLKTPAVSSFAVGDGAKWILKTLAEIKTLLKLSDNYLIQLPAGNLLTDGSTGFCDSGEIVKTILNSQMIKVNKFEKGESGQADLPFAPDIWNVGTVTPSLRQLCLDLNVLDACDSAWTYLTNVTGSNDTTEKVEGTGSVKLVVADGFTTGIVTHKTITSVNLTGVQYFYLWVKSTVALNAGDWQFCVDDTAAIASPVKTYDLPAISANTWTLVELVAGDVSGCTAIISIGLKQAVDKGAMTMYVDYVGWTGNVTWGIQAVAVASGETPDVAFGTAQEYTAAIRYYKETVITFSALTIAGTPAIGERLRIQVYRKNNASDTHGTAKACFAGAKLVCTKG